MRLLHTSDWHLGRSLLSVPLIEEQRIFLQWLVDQVREHEVDAVLITGDVYDRAVPSVEAIGLLEAALVELASTSTVVMIPGNHDSPTRLGFAGPLLEAARVHVRADVTELARPIVITDSQGMQCALYCIPYLEPHLQADRLASARSHEAVLTAAMSIIRSAHSFEMPMIVLSHSFISGGITSDSERDVQVGGIPHAPISLFAGVSYLALGHLHRPQQIGASSGVLARYAGSPLAYSFSEEGQEKSVVLIDVASNGDCAVDLLQAPSPRPLTTIRGELASLLSEPRYQDVQEHWIRAVLTDSRRPESPMERIRQRFPHTLQLEFAPEGVNPGELQPAMSAAQQDPSLVVAQFIEYVTGTDATEHEMALIHEAVVRVRMGMVV